MNDLKEEFATWLSRETWNWTTYATLTFSRPMLKDALHFGRAWARFIARTAQELWGFVFQEAHSDGQRLHLHCLFSIRPNLLLQPTNEEMWSWWFRRFGRAQVSDYRHLVRERPLQSPSPHQIIVEKFVTPLASYVSKYVVKEAFSGGFNWDFMAFSAGNELTHEQFARYSWVEPPLFAKE